jgi:protein gp37
VRDQCQVAGVPFFFKQWGQYQPFSTVDGFQELPFGSYSVEPPYDNFIKKGKAGAGRTLDSREWNDFPEAAR